MRMVCTKNFLVLKRTSESEDTLIAVNAVLREYETFKSLRQCLDELVFKEKKRNIFFSNLKQEESTSISGLLLISVLLVENSLLLYKGAHM